MVEAKCALKYLLSQVCDTFNNLTYVDRRAYHWEPH